MVDVRNKSTECQCTRKDPLTDGRIDTGVIVDEDCNVARKKRQADTQRIQFDTKSIKGLKDERNGSGRETRQPKGRIVGVNVGIQQNSTKSQHH